MRKSLGQSIRKAFVVTVALLMVAGLLPMYGTRTASAAFNQWSSTGPYGGNVLGMAISPNFTADTTAFAVTNGGVFKTVNGGTTWAVSNTGLDITDMLSIGISPNFAADQTLFAGTHGGGVFKTVNGATTWAAANGGLPAAAGPLGFAFSNNFAADNTVFTTLEGENVWKSTNGGTSWVTASAGITDPNVPALAASPNFSTDNTLFAGTFTEGVFKSTNGGTTWTTASAGITDPEILSLAVSPNFAADNTLFAGTHDGGIFRSTNRGTSWTEVTGGALAGVMALGISPNFATDNTLFAATEAQGVFKSINGGNTWVAVNTGLTNLSGLSLMLAPNYNETTLNKTVFVGTDGDGVFKSTDGAANWAFSSNGMGNYITSIVKSPNFLSDRTIFASSLGGGVYKSTDAASTWTQINTGLTNTRIHALAISPNYANDKTIFAGTDRSGIWKSTNGGATWSEANTAQTADRIVLALALPPNFAANNTVFAGTRHGTILKSTDGGTNWGVTNIGPPVLSLATTPNYATNQTVFAGVRGGDSLFKTTNGGTSWVASNSGIPADDVQSLGVSPDYATDQTVFAGTSLSGVFKTTNGGTSWALAATGLPTDPVTGEFLAINAVAASPAIDDDNTVFSGTVGGGIFRSANRGSTWTAINTGLTSMQVNGIAVNPNFNEEGILDIGTGAGIFTNTLDTRAPTGTVLINSGAVFTNKAIVTFSFNMTDAVSGVSQMRFATSSASLASASYSPFITPVTAALAGPDGFNSLSAQFKDAAGNETGNLADSIVLDTVPPVATVVVNNDDPVTNDATTMLTVTGVDGTSGPDKMRIAESTAALNTTPYKAFSTIDVFELSAADGTKSVHVQIKDAAGNESAVVQDSILLDDTSPSGNVRINNNAAYTRTRNVVVTTNCTDNLTGCSNLKLASSHGGLGTALTQSYSATKAYMLTSGNGVKSVFGQYFDDAGNFSAVVSDQIVYDTKTPMIKAGTGISVTRLTNSTWRATGYPDDPSCTGRPVGCSLTSRIVAMAFNANNGVLVSTKYSSWTGDGKRASVNIALAPGTYIIKIYFQDAAGNIVRVRTVTVRR